MLRRRIFVLFRSARRGAEQAEQRAWRFLRGAFSGLRDLILRGFEVGPGSALLPHRLDELLALIAQNALRAADGVTLGVEQVLDAAQQVDILGPVVAAAPGPLHRLDLREPAFPEAQHVLGNVELVRDFADGTKSVWCLFHGPVPPFRLVLLWNAGSTPRPDIPSIETELFWFVGDFDAVDALLED